ncbi:MAG: hypothetical protein P4M09_02225 [Devosia sp.]|nr:hypothetical protein [Devosia sp.]
MTVRPLIPFEGMDIRTLIDGQAVRRGGHPFLVWEPAQAEVIATEGRPKPPGLAD